MADYTLLYDMILCICFLSGNPSWSKNYLISAVLLVIAVVITCIGGLGGNNVAMNFLVPGQPEVLARPAGQGKEGNSIRVCHFGSKSMHVV